jgi:hypothetical protein
MRFRVTIEADGGKSDGGYQQWEEAYQQEIQDLDVAKVVTFLNSGDVKKVVRVRNRKPAVKSQAKPQVRAEMPQAEDHQAEEVVPPSKYEGKKA